jgi:hypothetical protein
MTASSLVSRFFVRFFANRRKPSVQPLSPVEQTTDADDSTHLHNLTLQQTSAGQARFTVRSASAGDHSVFGTRPPLRRLALCYDDPRRSLLSANSLASRID